MLRRHWMEKNEFLMLLQAALFAFDGVSEEEIIQNGLPKQYVEAGVRLVNYLKTMKITA